MTNDFKLAKEDLQFNSPMKTKVYSESIGEGVKYIFFFLERNVKDAFFVSSIVLVVKEA